MAIQPLLWIHQMLVPSVGIFLTHMVSPWPTFLEQLPRSLMQKLLLSIQLSAQSAFIKGRDIIGNVLICQDLIKMYGRGNCSPRIIMKLDLQQAYDSVDWQFMNDMLRELGFPDRIQSLIMQCVFSPTFTFVLNGESFGFVQGKRGLRQGDPLSPLLFTLCLEYLSRLLEVIQRHSSFRYYPLCKQVRLVHLCFADDLIFFSKGDVRFITLLCYAFEKFSKASGLKMNKQKSSFYSNGISTEMIEQVESLIGIKRGMIPFTYLGINVSPKRLSVKDCNCLVEKIVQRIRGIGFRKLSYAGRAVLIRAVLSTLHYYWARIFVISKTAIKRIQAICRSFLWSGQENGDKMTLVAWESICRPRRQGRLDFKRLYNWNLAPIAKYVWWVCEKKDNLWVK